MAPRTISGEDRDFFGRQVKTHKFYVSAFFPMISFSAGGV